MTLHFVEGQWCEQRKESIAGTVFICSTPIARHTVLDSDLCLILTFASWFGQWHGSFSMQWFFSALLTSLLLWKKTQFLMEKHTRSKSFSNQFFVCPKLLLNFKVVAQLCADFFMFCLSLHVSHACQRCSRLKRACSSKVKHCCARKCDGVSRFILSSWQRNERHWWCKQNNSSQKTFGVHGLTLHLSKPVLNCFLFLSAPSIEADAQTMPFCSFFQFWLTDRIWALWNTFQMQVCKDWKTSKKNPTSATTLNEKQMTNLCQKARRRREKDHYYIIKIWIVHFSSFFRFPATRLLPC